MASWLQNLIENDLLDQVRTLVDFGIFILIWLVQLIIYPSFGKIEAGQFVKWHEKYTGLISIFVVPLMFSQVGLIVLQIIFAANVTVYISAALVLVAWCSTFGLSVPLHSKLSQRGNERPLVDKLVSTNWIRTVCWTIVWLLGASQLISTFQ